MRLEHKNCSASPSFAKYGSCLWFSVFFFFRYVDVLLLNVFLFLVFEGESSGRQRNSWSCELLPEDASERVERGTKASRSPICGDAKLICSQRSMSRDCARSLTFLSVDSPKFTVFVRSWWRRVNEVAFFSSVNGEDCKRFSFLKARAGRSTWDGGAVSVYSFVRSELLLQAKTISSLAFFIGCSLYFCCIFFNFLRDSGFCLVPRTVFWAPACGSVTEHGQYSSSFPVPSRT